MNRKELNMKEKQEETVQSKLASYLLGGEEALEKYDTKVGYMLSWLTDYNQDYVEDNLFRVLKEKLDRNVLDTIIEMRAKRWLKYRPLDIERCPMFIIKKEHKKEGIKVVIEIEPYGSN
jgi:hypothetical protein